MFNFETSSENSNDLLDYDYNLAISLSLKEKVVVLDTLEALKRIKGVILEDLSKD